MCNSLPVPTPSLFPRGAYGGVAYGQPATGVAVTATAFRDAFNNADGGCFGPGTLVLMHSTANEIRQQSIETLVKGDLVMTPGGPAKVACLVKYSGARTLRLPGSGLVITPWHPVQMKDDDKWQFPADIVADHMIENGLSLSDASSFFASMDSCVYNLVLEAGHVVTVDGVRAVTLGHGMEGQVVAHPYWGTGEVVEDLRAQPGFEHGLVDLGRVERRVDRGTGLVSGIRVVEGMKV